jgi:hypothetical protein
MHDTEQGKLSNRETQEEEGAFPLTLTPTAQFELRTTGIGTELTKKEQHDRGHTTPHETQPKNTLSLHSCSFVYKDMPAFNIRNPATRTVRILTRSLISKFEV